MLQNELDMSFNYVPITYGEIKEGEGKILNKNSKYYQTLCLAKPGDKAIADILQRTGQKVVGFNDKVAWDCDVLSTIRAGSSIYVAETKGVLSKEDIIHSQTFPEDYDFGGGYTQVNYICGMSVPPIMIKRIVTKLIEGGVFNVTK